MKRLIPLLLLILLPGLALASSPLTCNLTVRVVDAAKAPKSALVTNTDERTGWRRTKFTNKRGRVYFRGIRPDAGGHQTIIVRTATDTQVFSHVKCPLGQDVRGTVVVR